MCAFPRGLLFLVTHLIRLFGVFHRFKTPIKGCRVIDSFVLLDGFEFLVGMYGSKLLGAVGTVLFRFLLG